MGLTKEEKNAQLNHRREAILKLVSQPSGATGTYMAQKFDVSRGTILKDIAALRRQGYPIQVASHTEEGGMIVAVYELPKYRPR